MIYVQIGIVIACIAAVIYAFLWVYKKGSKDERMQNDVEAYKKAREVWESTQRASAQIDAGVVYERQRVRDRVRDKIRSLAIRAAGILNARDKGGSNGEGDQ